MTNALAGKSDGLDTPCISFNLGHNTQVKDTPNGSVMHHINHVRARPITEGFEVSEQEQADLKASRRSLDSEYAGLEKAEAEQKGEQNHRFA